MFTESQLTTPAIGSLFTKPKVTLDVKENGKTLKTFNDGIDKANRVRHIYERRHAIESQTSLATYEFTGTLKCT